MPAAIDPLPSSSSADEMKNNSKTATIKEEHAGDINDGESSTSSSSSAVRGGESLQGTLYYKWGKDTGFSRQWKKRHVVLDLTKRRTGTKRGNASISVFKQDKYVSHNSSVISSRRHQRQDSAKSSDMFSASSEAEFVIQPSSNSVNYVVKDVENDECTFLIEVDALLMPSPTSTATTRTSTTNGSIKSKMTPQESNSSSTSSPTPPSLCPMLKIAYENSIKKQKDVIRIYFQCCHQGEKVLWLSAFQRLGKLSKELRPKKGLQTLSMMNVSTPSLFSSSSSSGGAGSTGNTLLPLQQLLLGRTHRQRSHHAEKFIRECNYLPDASIQSGGGRLEGHSHNSNDFMSGIFLTDRARLSGDANGDTLKKNSNGEREYMVYPNYAYPNKYMTRRELTREMLKPSETFHDLRLETKKGDEIGILNVEVLECRGLPKLDYASQTDAVTYLVCGSYAFITDIIWNRQNPMWLAKSRRACKFPLYDGFAQLFIGVFDDDGKKCNDDFAGRAVIDLARLRPHSRYDVTLPLRTSSHVYSIRPRGVIRLRFSMEWYSERDALLSYIKPILNPKMIQSRLALDRPNDDVTVICADEKAFRNIAITVHGHHMPGHFSIHHVRATLLEFALTRKVIFMTIKNFVLDVMFWKTPGYSALLFVAWMHGVKRGDFSLFPAYACFFISILLLANHYLTNSNSPFIPPTAEELASVLMNPRYVSKKGIEPLEVNPQRGESSKAEFVTYRPTKGVRWLFHILFGFKEDTNIDDDFQWGMDFPYSQGLHKYRKRTVNESLVQVSKKGSSRRVIQSTSPIEGYESSFDGDALVDMDDSEGSGEKDLTDVAPKTLNKRLSLGRGSNHSGQPLRSTTRARRLSEDSNDLDSFSLHKLKNMMKWPSSRSRSSSEQSVEDDESDSSDEFAESDKKGGIPEQNIHIRIKSSKTLQEELQEFKNNAHRTTFHLFNDRTYVVRNPNESRYFGKASKKLNNVNSILSGSGGTNNNSTLTQEFDKLLSTGTYSSTNPLVARVGVYLEPMIGAALSGLSLFRALHNIVTWQDSMLSFWVTTFSFAMTILLFVFPWRLFFLIVGVLCIGPQNLVFRSLYEKEKLPEAIRRRIFLLQKRSNFGRTMGMTNLLQKSSGPPIKDQPIITCQKSGGSPAYLNLQPDQVDARAVHEISVPYSRFMYHRFYDWPPEVGYSKVRRTDL